MIDYQWPTVKALPTYIPTSNWEACEGVYASIETALSKQFGVSAVLLPSARAGIASILEFYGVNRKHQVFAPQFSSHCVWDVISRFSNPTIAINSETDILLAVHKWGYTNSFEVETNAQIIEDSVDTIIQDGDVFPLHGEFEVLSLPKILGTYCGGVVLTNNKEYIKKIKNSRLDNKVLIAHQSEMKYKKQIGNLPPFTLPEHLEVSNRGLDLFGLEHIAAHLSNYDLNLKTIQNRIDRLNTHFDQEVIKAGLSRLPCIFPARFSQFNIAKPELFMQRQFNCSCLLDGGQFEACWLLPLHFGVIDELFEEMLLSMQLTREA